MTLSELKRFIPKIKKEIDCWMWTGATHNTGYGIFWMNDDFQLAHRISYQHFTGEIVGVIDHLCRNRKCVNPDHLEDVTSGENVLRGEGQPARNARKTHCFKGHEFTNENLIVWPSRPRTRICRLCRLEYYQKRKDKNK